MFQDIEKPLSLMEVARSNREGMNFAIATDTRVWQSSFISPPSAYLCVQTYIEKVSLRQVNVEGLKLL
jgi:hypothetical protein